MDLNTLYNLQKDYFNSQATKNVAARIDALKKLKAVIERREKDVYKALEKDLGKSQFESFITEYKVVISELDKFISNIKSWSKPRWVWPALLNFPSTARIHLEPYGNTLIISPWNYPFQLALGPLIGAIAAGNTVILKPSEFSMATSQLLEEIISEAFLPEHATVRQGDAVVAQSLTALKWDYIFFTGSSAVGKKIYQAAAAHLTPVTLELGGKNPCVVDRTATIEVTARRIVWAKFLNTGQTCIAPDYILVHESVKEELVTALRNNITAFYDKDIKSSPDYSRIIREEHLDKLISYIKDEKITHGGDYSKTDLYLEPTILDEPVRDSAVMQQEIFGPILPIITYKDKSDIERWVTNYEKSLGAYIFTQDKTFSSWFIDRFSYGGGVINDSIVQFVNERLPFGGVGASGIGSYHGKKTFETFSHHKSMVHRRTWLDLKVKYPPYKGKLAQVKSLLKWF